MLLGIQASPLMEEDARGVARSMLSKVSTLLSSTAPWYCAWCGMHGASGAWRCPRHPLGLGGWGQSHP